ncbi:phage tail protein [Sphingomonas aracearum]|uniref:Oxidoreductase n=1 Tax=Sphingomonas aracearum TaxID=2283317 RepID=A0A369VQK7_9SPHN|nr:phage tail protein [Sphingomonas aracearum]RDE04678.1 oxidoreductase [Sphingomonas aracearum]
MLLALGTFPFGIDTLAHDELQRRTSWRQATTPRIGARDATQFVGPGEETISLPGSVFLEIADGSVSLDELRRMAATGDAWALVDGLGYIYGAYVITGVDDRGKHFLPDGTPRQIDFAIELLRVDVDPR